jgi:hypothetical protein
MGNPGLPQCMVEDGLEVLLRSAGWAHVRSGWAAATPPWGIAPA